MAKAKTSTAVCDGPSSDRQKWEVDDALRTLTRAHQIVKDKALMADVKKAAAEKATQMSAIAGKMDSLAKMGLVSEKAREKAEHKAR